MMRLCYCESFPRLLIELGTLRPTFPSSAWSGTVGTCAGSCLSDWALRAELFFGNLAVAIFVELLERLRGFGEFVGVNGAVLVNVERFDDRADWTKSLAAGANITGRTISLWTISLWAISLWAISLWAISLWAISSWTISLWTITSWLVARRAFSGRPISARWSWRRCVLGDDEVR